MNLLLVFVISFVIISLGGGAGWFFWYKSKPKSRTWTARCYTIGEGVLTRSILEKKKDTGYKIRLKDLKPYTVDILKKVTKRTDTIYKLVRQNLTTGAVTADMVDNWGKDKLEVNVLIHGDSATLMRKSYDWELGTILFRPMDRELMEMIKSEMTIQTSRYEETKSMLLSLAPYITFGIILFGLLAVSYFISDALIKISDRIVTATEVMDARTPNQPTNDDGTYGVTPVDQSPPAKAEIG